MGLLGSQHFRVLSNLTRLSIVPSLLAIACSEVFKHPFIPKTGASLYFLTGTMTVLMGVLILCLLESKKDNISPYSNPFLNALLFSAEATILTVCRILKFPAYLMIVLGIISTPIFAVLSKSDEFQGMPVVLVPDWMLNLTLGNIIAMIFIAAVTSGHGFPIYRSFKALKKFDSFIAEKGKLTLIEHWPIFGEWVPSFTFYTMRVLKNLGAIVYNLIVKINERIPLKKFLIVFRPLIWFSEWLAFALTWSLWATHQALILTLRWSATLATFVLFAYFLYLNSSNFLNHIGHINLMVIARFAAMFLATFYTFALAYLFHLDMRFFAETERKAVSV